MDKKLPGVYANNIDKKIENNKKVFYSAKAAVEKEERSSKPLELQGKNITQKINEMFNSTKYIYKIDVDITLKNGKVSKRIVGKNATHLITMENELIPIADIIDIEFPK